MDAFIDGRYVPARSGRTIPVVSPIDGQVIDHIPACDEADVNRAVQAARAAFEDGRWSRLAPKERKRILLRFADLIGENAEELAALETRDMGMPIKFARHSDLGAARECVAWYAEAIDKIYDQIAPMQESELALVTREPLGVIGAITPWNVPLMIAAWKIAPALAAGNSVVIKPAEDASLATLRLGALALEAGIPAGVLNIVTGAGLEAGRALALHMDVDALAFTGSGVVGRRLLEYSAQSNVKPVYLELGGKSASLVMADAADLDAASAAIAQVMFANQGQICNAPSRLLVQRSVHDAVVERIVTIASTLKVGDPRDQAHDLGPLVNQSQLDSVLGKIEKARTAGAALAIGGRRVLESSGGYYVEPTVFADVDPGSDLAQQEVFGPVLATIPFDTLDEGIALANSTRYGLGAAIWSSNVDTALTAARRLRAGIVFVNGYGSTAVELPFGGFKESGFGRDRSLHALDKYTGLKSTLIRLAQP